MPDAAGKRYVSRNLGDVKPLSHTAGSIYELSDRRDWPHMNAAVAEITDDDRHHHAVATELYFVLEGHGTMYIDGDTVNLGPGSYVLLKPGAVHRATANPGERLKILVASSPSYNSDDTIPDESEA